MITRAAFLAPVLVATLAPAVNASPITVHAFADVTVELDRNTVIVHRGALSAHLYDAPAHRRFAFDAGPDAIKIDRELRTITLHDMNECSEVEAPVTFIFAQASSRLDNVAAYRLHARKRYAQAVAGFAHALAEDPENRVAALNLASAQQLLGQRADAVTTLGPWLVREPAETYATIAGDPELAPLLSEPSIAALVAKQPGVTTLAGLTHGIGYSPERHRIAVVREECSWGYDGPGACGSELELFELPGGRQLASLTLSTVGPQVRGDQPQHVAAIERTLHDLGFVAPAVIVGVESTTDADRALDKRKFSLASLRIGVVDANGSVNVLRGNTSLATANTLEKLHGADYVPAAQVLVLSSGRAGAEGCEGTDPTATDLVPLSLPMP